MSVGRCLIAILHDLEALRACAQSGRIAAWRVELPAVSKQWLSSGMATLLSDTSRHVRQARHIRQAIHIPHAYLN